MIAYLLESILLVGKGSEALTRRVLTQELPAGLRGMQATAKIGPGQH